MIEATPTDHVTDGATIDKIRVEYHPKSRKPPKVCHIEEYDSGSTRGRHTPAADPWWPDFKSQGDFEYTEIVLRAHLSNELSDKLISLINRCIEGKDELTFKGQADVENCYGRSRPSG
jgi:hypothetical protein